MNQGQSTQSQKNPISGSNEQLQWLAQTSLRLNQIETVTEVADFVCRQVKTIIGKGYVALSLLDEAKQMLSVKALQGLEDENLLNTVLRLAGTDPRQMQVSVQDFNPEELNMYKSGRLEFFKDGIYSLLIRQYPRTVCSAIEHLLGIRYVYTMGFMHHGLHIGGMAILTDSRDAVETNKLVIESVMAQAAAIINRLRVEEALEKSRDKYCEIVEQTLDGIMVTDPNGNVEIWNKGIELITGINRCDAIGFPVWQVQFQLFPDKLRISELMEKVKNSVKNILESKQEYKGQEREQEIQCVGGKRKFVQTTSFIIKHDATLRLGTIMRDITARKEAEAQDELLVRENQALNDLKLLSLRTNIDLDQLLQEFVGQLPSSWQYPVITYARLVIGDREFRTENYKDSPWKQSAPVKIKGSPDGKLEVGRLEERPDQGDGPFFKETWDLLNRVAERLGLVIDRKHTEAKLVEHYEKLEKHYQEEKRLRQELQEEAKARGMFIDILAHELRTPLTPLLVCSAMLQETLDSADATIQKRLIQTMHKGTQSLTQRLEELLDLGKLSRGTFTLRKQPVNVTKLVSKMAAQFKPLAEQQSRQLNLEIQDNLPEIEADPARLEQVLDNLLSNAVKYSPKNTAITLKAVQTGDNIVIEVQDEGTFLTSEEQKKLFDPYHRVMQDTQKYPGIGLGLAICKLIVEAHAGSIGIESKEDKGACFSVKIPVKIRLEDNNETAAG